MNKIEGYEGICSACSCPIKMGEGMQIVPGGRHFHSTCVVSRPNSYYVRLERRKIKKNPQEVTASQGKSK